MVIPDTTYNRPAVCGFLSNTFLIGLWERGLYKMEFNTTSVEDFDLVKNNEYSLEDKKIIFDKSLNKQYEIFDLTGRKLENGFASKELDFSKFRQRVLFISIEGNVIKVIN